MKRLCSVVMGLGCLGAEAFTLSFESADFVKTPLFSNVTTFDFEAQLAGPLQAGAYSDPGIDTIGYNVSGSLATTPSGFSGFGLQLSHLVAPPPALPTFITGSLFYSLNPGAPAGDRLSFTVLPTADLSDGLQVSELAGSGSDVVFRFNAIGVSQGFQFSSRAPLPDVSPPSNPVLTAGPDPSPAVQCFTGLFHGDRLYELHSSRSPRAIAWQTAPGNSMRTCLSMPSV